MPKSRIAKELGMNVKTLDKLLLDFGVYYNGRQCRDIAECIESGQYIKLHDYLQTVKYPRTSVIREKLIIEGYKDAVCEQCRRREWMNVPIPLELHHIDGDHSNVSIDNFQLLCPNCHALTPNYRGRNIRKEQIQKISSAPKEQIAEIVQEISRDVTPSQCYSENSLTKTRVSHKEHKRNRCIDCDKPIKTESKRCIECSRIHRRKCIHPDRDTLLSLILSKSFCAIGKQYGVTDATVRKWCQQYQLPYNKKTLDQYKAALYKSADER